MAKRIMSSSINWALIAQGVPNQIDKEAFQAFKIKSENFMKRIVDSPSELPKIDWDFYKSRISTPGLVEAYKKGYESIKIPYPGDQGKFAKVDEQLAKANEEYVAHTKYVNEKVKELQVELKKVEEALPYSEMCIEEYFVANPELALDHDNPNFPLEKF